MSTRERVEHVRYLIEHGDPDEAVAALIAAQRDGYRFTFRTNGTQARKVEL